MKDILKDFVRMVFGMKEDVPVSNQDMWFSLSGLVFLIMMLSITKCS